MDVTGRQTYTLVELARILGISRTSVYDLARADQLPVPVIRLGGRIVVSRAAVEQLLRTPSPLIPKS